VHWQNDYYLVSTDPVLLQIRRIHRFLSTKAYWCLGIPLAVVETAKNNSLCFGIYDQGGAEKPQIGYARVITDKATFGWICDVYIEEEHRGRGLSKWLMECVLNHPDLKNLRRVGLSTKSAHSLYEKFGFAVTQSPQNIMEIKKPNVYQEMNLKEFACDEKKP
jgi:GNAT superfamily N-acetyltransferase